MLWVKREGCGGSKGGDMRCIGMCEEREKVEIKESTEDWRSKFVCTAIGRAIGRGE